MGSSFLSEVDDTSILRTGALHRYHYPLTWLSASRLLLPRSGLERSNFVHWHETDMPTAMRDVRSQGRSGKHMLGLSSSQFDPNADMTVFSFVPMRPLSSFRRQDAPLG